MYGACVQIPPKLQSSTRLRMQRTQLGLAAEDFRASLLFGPYMGQRSPSRAARFAACSAVGPAIYPHTAPS